MNEQIKKVYMFVTSTEDLSDEFCNQIFSYALKMLSTNSTGGNSSEVFIKLYEEVGKKQIEVIRNKGLCTKIEYFNESFLGWIKSSNINIIDIKLSIMNKQLFVFGGNLKNPKNGQQVPWCVYIYFFKESIKSEGKTVVRGKGGFLSNLFGKKNLNKEQGQQEEKQKKQLKQPENSLYDFFTDSNDGRVYKTVTIGKQTLFAENLAFKPGSGIYCAYDDDQRNVAKYGYLYSWETACKIAEDIKGWHLPTKEEWESMHKFFGGDDIKVYNAIKEGGACGFNALLGGYMDSYGTFRNIDKYASFWSATPRSATEVWYFNCFGNEGEACMAYDYPLCCLSVRLFRD